MRIRTHTAGHTAALQAWLSIQEALSCSHAAVAAQYALYTTKKYYMLVLPVLLCLYRQMYRPLSSLSLAVVR
jgi:hypothetical protein